MNAIIYRLLLISNLFIFTSVCTAKESDYQRSWCNQNRGRTEVVLPDKSRCDCVTDTHAVEIEYARKWAEAIGQALFYSLQTGKRAGIVLIIEAQKDRKHWIRLNSTIEHFKLPIDTFPLEK